MSLPLRGVSQVQSRGFPTLGPEIRRFSKAAPLIGDVWQFTTSDQHSIRIISTANNSNCLWCREQIIENIGIPVSLRTVGNNKEIETCGRTCCYECSAAIIVRELSTVYTKRISYYNNSWQLLNLMFSWQYPGKHLIPSPDLLLSSGNSVETLRAHKCKFVPWPSIQRVNTPINYNMLSLV